MVVAVTCVVAPLMGVRPRGPIIAMRGWVTRTESPVAHTRAFLLIDSEPKIEPLADRNVETAKTFCPLS